MAEHPHQRKTAQPATAPDPADAQARATAAPVPDEEVQDTTPPSAEAELEDAHDHAESGPAEPDKKRAPRFLFQVPVEIELGRESGRGRVEDMSKSGARIEQPTIHPEPGAKVKLRFGFFKNSPPIAVSGTVVRTTDTGGFGVVFANLDPRTRRALLTLLPKIGTAQPYSPRETRDTETLTLSIPRDVHARCAEAAKKSGRSLNEWLVDAIEEAVDGS
jgi:hypothetical protein